MLKPPGAAIALACLLASPAAAEQIDAASFVAAITGDWNKDGAEDLALLSRGQEDMDLHFFLQDPERQYLKPAGVARGKVWGRAGPDTFFGQEPSLKALPNGSIQVTTRNDTIGRDRWSQTLTLAYRNTDFVVAGFTYSYYDTLDLNSSGDCDLNVLTGKGIASKPDGKGGHIKLQIAAGAEFIPFKDWPADGGMKVCGIGG
ncbi:hypothetical protein JJB09_04400 [Rhizobium sp. KVB221]|uniref:VCBS repeat-containing protein n=1 Tax=Rhizobium setariae TaxID=2801340 RepID=A0A936YRK5_9HYPH|nr:hypothetical protein [Rhizobium setariae]MBL0371262.1 hypothetical protein [Rhizobium setariae]